MVTSEAAPARLGRYELIARLAAGGMGEIFLARLEGAAGFEKLFVIKRILPHLAGDARFRGMLIAEARIASVMSHPNICQVYELGETDGQLYIVMEYLEGITLLPLLHKMSKDSTPLALGFVGGVIQQAIDGLHYAHELKDRSGEYLGIVHRDVTPSNIFLTESGIAKILDFGIAKVKDASARTQTGTVKGKYAYMAPEQLRGGAIDRRADVFALGIVLYEMLALRRLFQRQTDYLTFRAAMEQPIPDVRHYRPDCPAALSAILARALDRDPDHRFASARQLGSAVIDAISPIQRPWSQGEIGDFVVQSFGDNMHRRDAQIASAVRTGGTSVGGPMILPSDEDLEVSTENEFPPVDSAVSDSPLLPPGHTGHPGHPGHADTVASPASPALEAYRGVPGTVLPHVVAQAPSTVVGPRRSVLWPIVVVAMVAVTAGALFLVWRQTQVPTTTRFEIIQTPGSTVSSTADNTLVAGPSREPAAGAALTLDVGSDAPRAPVEPAKPTTAPKGQRAVPSSDYRKALLARIADLNGCMATHGELPRGTSLNVVIDPAGRPKRVRLAPDSVDAAPVAGCIRDVVNTIAFPHSAADFHLDVNLQSR